MWPRRPGRRSRSGRGGLASQAAPAEAVAGSRPILRAGRLARDDQGAPLLLELEAPSNSTLFFSLKGERPGSARLPLAEVLKGREDALRSEMKRPETERLLVCWLRSR
jgi:hypothetical protein